MVLRGAIATKGIQRRGARGWRCDKSAWKTENSTKCSVEFGDFLLDHHPTFHEFHESKQHHCNPAANKHRPCNHCKLCISHMHTYGWIFSDILGLSLSNFLSLSLSLSIIVYLPIYLSTYLPIYLSIHPSTVTSVGSLNVSWAPQLFILWEEWGSVGIWDQGLIDRGHRGWLTFFFLIQFGKEKPVRMDVLPALMTRRHQAKKFHSYPIDIARTSHKSPWNHCVCC